MLAALVKTLDWLTIQLAGLGMRASRSSCVRGGQASELSERDLFHGLTEASPNLSFSTRRAFQFPSPVITPWSENNTVHGRLYCCAGDWQTKPAVILLHGWNGEYGYYGEFPYLAWRLARAGVNTAMIELPYHGKRRPRSPGAVRNFISDNLTGMLEATRQAITDTRSLLGWLEGQGCPSVGVWGFSLGAWIAGLISCADARTKFAVLLTPVVKIDRAINELAFCEPIRRSLNGKCLPLDVLDLASHRPKLSPENILIVESRHDLFAPVETVEAVWRAWGRTQIMRVNHGHISVLLSLPIMERVVKWIARKALVESISPLGRSKHHEMQAPSGAASL